MLVVITGTPGTGKTAVAEILAKRLGAKMLDLKEIALRNKLILGYDEKHKSMVINNTGISKAVKKELKKGNYVLDSHLGQFVSPKLVDLVVVLRCEPKVLEKRLQKRFYSPEKIAENAMAETIDVCLVEAIDLRHSKHLHEIDTTKRSAVSVAAEILEIVAGKKRKKFGDTHWLK